MNRPAFPASLPDYEYGGDFLSMDRVKVGCFLTRVEESRFGPGWLLFEDPLAPCFAFSPDQVFGQLEYLESMAGEGFSMAGFLSFEAAPAFEDRAVVLKTGDAPPGIARVPRAPGTQEHGSLPELPERAGRVRSQGGADPLGAGGVSGFPEHAGRVRSQVVPVLGFHVYGDSIRFFKELEPVEAPNLQWSPEIGFSEYRRGFDLVKDHLEAGDSYQVNYTFRLKGPETPLLQSFFHLASAGLPPYASYYRSADFEDPDRVGVFIGKGTPGEPMEPFEVCSLSPELFFDLAGSDIACKPMKGTAAPTSEGSLEASEKDRAENLMIVDMIRNDLGRIARTGSVDVSKLFEIERYPSVLQMTSTVTAETTASVPQILKALFPCASVVGAPKISTLGIIAEVEAAPRGLYTGAIGYIAPNRRSRFSVAIRTATRAGSAPAAYSVGSGVVWDSTASGEWEECLLKAQALHAGPADWGLLETLLWTPGSGYFLLDEHLDRMAGSALELSLPFDAAVAAKSLQELAATLDQESRVRLVWRGDPAVTASVLGARESFSARLADRPVSSQDPSLRIKQTRRWLYDSMLARAQPADEVLLWNERGELTEFSFGNLVLRFGDELLTPPVECGLLPGLFRAQLLRAGAVRETVLPVERLNQADEVWHVNSVRRWTPVRMI